MLPHDKPKILKAKEIFVTINLGTFPANSKWKGAHIANIEICLEELRIRLVIFHGCAKCAASPRG